MKAELSVCSSEEESWDTVWKWSWFTRKLWESKYWKNNQRALQPLFSLLPRLGIESILDCSCGLGFKTILLAKKGYDVEGSDGSGIAIEHAPHLAREQGLDIRFFCSRWEELHEKCKRRYDCVVSDYFDETRTLGGLKASARGIFSVLEEGGEFVFCSIRPRANLSMLIEREWRKRKKFEILPSITKAGVRVTSLEVADRVQEGILEKRIFLIEKGDSMSVEIAPVMNPRIKWRFRDYDAVLRHAGFRKVENIKNAGQTLGVATK